MIQDWFLDLLIDPVIGTPLRLDGERLVNDAGAVYPIIEGIPRLVDDTEGTFTYKWARRSAYESPEFAAWYTRWLLDKYGFDDGIELRAHFGRFERVLEVGCGAGLSAVISRGGLDNTQHWVGLDLSSAIDIAHQRLGQSDNSAFIQADLGSLPFRPGSFDAVFSEGVLHHTASTRAALGSLVDVLAPGGEVMFYVYRRKAPVRELADDYIRTWVSALAPDEAWALMAPLTSLAKALSNVSATVEVPDSVPVLGITAGRHDLQRLIYWHFAKLFWNDALGFEGSQLVNFDWYYPRHANRHTQAEVESWCAEFGLLIVHLDAQESGFTVRAIRRAA